MKKSLICILLVIVLISCSACSLSDNSSIQSGVNSVTTSGNSSTEDTSSKDTTVSDNTTSSENKTESATENKEEVTINLNSNTSSKQPDVWDKYKEGVIKVENFTGKEKGNLLVFNKVDMYGDKSINVIGASITQGQNAVKMYDQSYISIFKNTLNKKLGTYNIGYVSLCTPLESGGAVHSEIHKINKKIGKWSASWPTEGGTPGNYPLTESSKDAVLEITLNRKQDGIDRHINGFYVYYVKNSNYGSFDVLVNSEKVATINCNGSKNKCARSEYIKIPSDIGDALTIEIVKTDAKTVAICGMSYIDDPNAVIVNNYSLSGFSVGQMEDELLRQLGKANIVIFTLGYNDVGYGTDIEKFKDKLDVLVESCNKNGSLLIVGSVFWARNGNKNWADKYKNELRSAVQNAKGYFIDFATLPTDKVLDVNLDGAHPTVSGHKLLGEKLCDFFGLDY